MEHEKHLKDSDDVVQTASPPAGVLRSEEASGTPAHAEDRKFVVALARGLDLLRSFTPKDRLLGNGELAARTGLAKSTVTRLTYTLSRMGYLRHDLETNRYALDTGVFVLAQSFLGGSDLPAALHEPMRAVARTVGAAVSIGCRDDLDMVYLDTIRSETALTLGLAPGSRLSMLTSSMGRAWLAEQTPGQREKIWTALRAQPAQKQTHGQHIETAIAQAQLAIEACRQDGFACSFQAWHPDVNAVAVPIYDTTARRLLVLSCSGPASSMSPAFFRSEIAPRLQELVQRYARH